MSAASDSRRFNHVAVLMGGLSAEREVSLNSGKACADALESENASPAATTAPAMRAGRWRLSGLSAKNRQAEATRGKRIIHPSQ